MFYIQYAVSVMELFTATGWCREHYKQSEEPSGMANTSHTRAIEMLLHGWQCLALGRIVDSMYYEIYQGTTATGGGLCHFTLTYCFLSSVVVYS